ncbi:E3 ubiquitin/ISG15 ligase TRIM25 isoform X5 [Nerophis ophidion]|uniref:E3 ubiquitin/ISG15 ligase TRIM25 isoform X5 n=1 Tax=Nerophis ophidion TaxID=159077 RepID=UPI002ADF2990|nr:E3 ubiquitin/ISG15 ligase TRIM25 isoform X5 [Nerophis ophidion]
MEDPDFSLLSLESELTCCICLSTFDCPVTIPCGHNFCQACLLDTWTATYDCPQCRTHYAVKPQLKKNTVLNTVVETFKERLRNSDLLVSKGDGGEAGKDERAEVNEKAEKSNKAAEHDGVRCDTCMEAKASKTCLTCMASFCAEHLRPHLDNPVFHVHQLTEPAGDLMERICMEHNKPVELYCPQHGRLVCVLCLNQKHKQCTLVSPDQQLIQKKSDMKKMLALLDRKIGQNESVIARVTDKQQALKDDADMIRLNMALEYQQIKDMLANDEHEASGLLDQELASAQKKLSNLMKLFKDNVKSLSKSKEEIKSLIQQPKTMVVLQASVDLPRAATIDVYAPQCNLDSPKVKAAQEFAVQLKEEMSQIFRQPLENRPALIKTTEEDTKDNKEKNTFLLETPPLQVKTDKKTQQKKKLTSTPKNAKGHLKKKFSSMENLLGVDGKTKLSAYASGPPLKTGGQASAVLGPHTILHQLAMQQSPFLMAQSNQVFQAGRDASAQTVSLKLTLSNKHVGCIIGRQGAKIHEICQMSGAQINIANPVEGSTVRQVTITGSHFSTNYAKYLINARLSSETTGLAAN